MVPRFIESDLDDCLTVCAVGGLYPFEWQETILEGWLGRNEQGKWSAPTCGNATPRQNGKTLGVTGARILYGMLVLCEEVVYTAHLQKTSTETFEGLADIFESRRLSKRVSYIRSALGREEIRLKNGARIKFLARTRGGGKGQHGDLLVFDEAQELVSSQQGSFLPAISARYNPQTIYTGTPPDDEAPAHLFRGIRNKALSGASGKIAWSEFSVDEIGDTSDPERWAQTNPSLGLLISPDTIATEHDQMDDATFATMRLGWWRPASAEIDPALDLDAWGECATCDPPMDGAVSYGVKFSVDGKRCALAACIVPEEGSPHIELVFLRDVKRGTGFIASWLSRRLDVACFAAIDGKSRAAALAKRLAKKEVDDDAYGICGSTEVAEACSMLDDAILARMITHYDQEQLNDSATKCPKRDIGKTGGWGFDETDEGDPLPIEAAAIAYRAAMTTERDPRREMRIG